MITHFTNKFDTLLSIISSNSFLLRYCGEYFGDKNGRVVSNAAHPMVSFSGYDSQELPTRRISYGGYGISLHKEWALKNGITPVNYIDKNSPVALGLIALLRSRQLNRLPNHLRLPVIQLKCFTKHVYGYNSYWKRDNYNFEYEKEWRYVPTAAQIKNNLISINFSAYEKRKEIYNKKIENFRLEFSCKDIRCVYVQNEHERKKIMSIPILSECQVIISPWCKLDELECI
nr:abortive infection system antitoxin AbiGi family protein [Serratia proteamaculans]